MINSAWKTLRIANKDGLLLAGLLKTAFLSEEANGALDSNRPIVVVCHGFTGTKEGSGRALAMGEELAALGFNTLLFDFAGCGESEGDWSDLTLSGQISDLSSVVAWCRQEGYSRVILVGRSFGGSTVIGYAPQDKNISAVCTWAAVARPDRLFYNLIKESPEGPADELITIESEEGRLELKRAFFLDLAKHDLLKCSAAISPRKLLVIHGSADETVPCNNAKQIYNAALEPKKLQIINGADHRFSNHINQVWEVFFNWLKALDPVDDLH